MIGRLPSTERPTLTCRNRFPPALTLLSTLCLFVLSQAATNGGQTPTATLRVQVRASEKPVVDAEVIVAAATHRTDASGTATVTAAPGQVEIRVAKAGFLSVTTAVTAAAGTVQDVTVELVAEPTLEEEVTVVAATRTGKRLEDQPMRVEVLAREEIEEKMLMTPGDIVMMLNEMGGMRVQATSPSLGAASVRIQGMRGRYTRFLSDGLPLFGEQVGGLGLLQIPPMDLGQVEVIKGVASSLYGAGAMGGVVNLISRRPGAEPEREFLLNRSTRGATDAVAFLSTPLSRRLGRLAARRRPLAADATDVDDDGWADLPGYIARRRPAAVVLGRRQRAHVLRDGGRHGRGPRRRHDATDDVLAGDRPAVRRGARHAAVRRRRRRPDAAAARYVVTARAARRAAAPRPSVRRGARTRSARHRVRRSRRARHARAGTRGSPAPPSNATPTRPRDVPRFAHTFTVPGVFVQDDVELAPWLSLSRERPAGSSQRVRHVLQPARLGARPCAARWTSRLSVGTGFFGPSPLTEETEAAGLSRLDDSRPLEAERGRERVVRRRPAPTARCRTR